jgi:hypothetical protein
VGLAFALKSFGQNRNLLLGAGTITFSMNLAGTQFAIPVIGKATGHNQHFGQLNIANLKQVIRRKSLSSA